MGKLSFAVKGMHCAGCAASVERAVRKLPGASDVYVNFAANRLTLEAGRYEWTVAAFNSGYETSSPALRLTVAEEPVSEEPEKSDNSESSES